jgi:hypothetical protein
MDDLVAHAAHEDWRCAQDTAQRAPRGSQRFGLPHHSFTKLGRKKSRRQHRHAYTGQLLCILLQTRQSEQSCPILRFDEQIEITVLGVGMGQHGTEYAWPSEAVAVTQSSQRFAVQVQGLGRGHVLYGAVRHGLFDQT